jgi:hypothetical protein
MALPREPHPPSPQRAPVPSRTARPPSGSHAGEERRRVHVMLTVMAALVALLVVCVLIVYVGWALGWWWPRPVGRPPSTRYDGAERSQAMLPRTLIAVVVSLALVGCARAMLPYRPDPQPSGARVSADYQVVGDRVRVEIDTDRRRLEQAWIMRPDGVSVAAQTVELPPVEVRPAPTISIGVGGGTWVSRGAHVGTGMGVGMPVGESPTRVAGHTGGWFPRDAAGPPPWPLYVKLAGIEPTTFLVGGPPPP